MSSIPSASLIFDARLEIVGEDAALVFSDKARQQSKRFQV
jgi:hypothetical protein